MVAQPVARQRFVGEPADDMQVCMADRLAGGRTHVPADSITIRQRSGEVSLGLFEQIEGVSPLDVVKIERRSGVAERDDHAGVLQDWIGAGEKVAGPIAEQGGIVQQAVSEAELAPGRRVGDIRHDAGSHKRRSV